LIRAAAVFLFVPMRIKKIQYLLFCLVCAGCTTDILIPIPETDAQLVLVGNFSPDAPIQVRVSTLQTVQDTLAPDFPLDATVLLYADDNYVDQLELALDSVSSQWMYQSTVKPVQGVRYRVVVRAPGYPELWAADALPPSGPAPVFVVDTANIEKTATDWTFQVQAQLPASNNHRWYMFGLAGIVGVYEQINDTWELQAYQEWPLLVNPNPGTSGYVYLAANYFALVQEDFWSKSEDRTLSMTVEMPFLSEPVRPHAVILVWRSISESGYRFYSSVNRQGDYDSPIGSPDAVYNNVIGGWGNFSGYVEVRDTVYF